MPNVGIIFFFEEYLTDFFMIPDFVLKRIQYQEKFNFLAIVIKSQKEYKNIKIADYEFVGYELLDLSFGISALINCGDFDETFLPKELNNKELIDNFNKACDIKNQLL